MNMETLIAGGLFGAMLGELTKNLVARARHGIISEWFHWMILFILSGALSSADAGLGGGFAITYLGFMDHHWRRSATDPEKYRLD